MAQNKVLIIDDDRNSVRFLQLELEHEGYLVEKEYDGLRGLQRATQENFDLILLDIMLPGLDGMEVLQKFRRVSETPVIMLTAKDAVSDKVLGLDGGADDYLTKPFAIEELLARMRAALKKNGAADGDRKKILSIGQLSVDRSTREVSYAGQPIQLTKREFDLLCYLMENHDIVCSRDKLMEKVWEYDFSGETNLVDVYIRYLRNKIDYRFHLELIRTIRGVGYIIKTYET
ncbi:Response regulator ArlR [Caprobacter fermentans]|uniref:Stage 0 sporulation protein A homolog n=1 Tax=Caproicibacter fermentans TaxID=2576756 RepID=A0A6N8I3H5_9FIRM|nr:response regulator transcription factor [Caproicibacter fermentans]MVB12582.1 Response regulator ArlR [Caproicibacter fermentans]OCN00012.1 DNA-binding response regulator [Clostridium sp. W14A]QNK39151.1 response regulator transcription factor [Caproicibacter fermentans]